MLNFLLTDINQNIYVFKGQHFWMVSKDGHVSKPQLLHQKWIGLPAFVEAAAVSGVDGKFYFFKGGRCWRYSASLLDTGFSMKCSSRGLPRHPDAAFHFQLLGHVVVFKGPKYYVLNEGSMLVEPYYPRSLLDWSGVPSGINGVLSWADGFLYFFKDDRYWRFDQSKLKVNATGKWAEDLKWMGC